MFARSFFRNLTGLSTVLALAQSLQAAGEKTGTDADGDKYTVKLSGPGTLLVDPVSGGGPLNSITLAGTNATSALEVAVVKATGGDGRVAIGKIVGTGSLQSIDVSASDFTGGGIDLGGGGAAVLRVGDLPAGAKVTLGADVAIKSLAVHARKVGAITLTSPAAKFSLSAVSVTGGAQFTVGAVSLLKTTAGDFIGDITASGRVDAVSVTGGNFHGRLTTPGTIGTFKVVKSKAGVGGAIASSVISAKAIGSIASAGPLGADITSLGKIVSLTVTGGDFNGRVGAGDSIGSVRVAKSKSGVGGSIVNSLVAAKNTIGVVSLDGSLINSQLLAGAQFGADLALGGSGANADFFKAGSIKSIDVRGDVTGSVIGAGLAPVNGVFNDGDDGVVGGKLSKIGSLTVRGEFDGASLLAAGVAVRHLKAGSASNLHFLARPFIVPPAPIATVLDTTKAIPSASVTAFLYTGSGAVQTGVAAGLIKPERASVLRGCVLHQAASPFAGVHVTVLDHAEYGETYTRADGAYDLAVNGGGKFVLKFEAAGALPVQRQVEAATQDFTMLPDVMMLRADPLMTTVTLGAGAPMQMHEASMQTDASSARHAALLFQADTSAMFKMPDGTMKAAPSALSIRATEFTVGPNGPKAMPGVLPSNSGYTYCAELSADETPEGATLEFTKPVYFYLENFLHFEAGIDVPSGFYNKQKGLWEAGPSGRIVKILSKSGGVASLDVDGDGNADTGAKLTALGITSAELMQLASSYSAQQSLWRVPIPHFSAWDCNWPIAPPADASSPNGDQPPESSDQPADPDDPTNVDIQTQVLRGQVKVSGTPFSLHYRSSRTAGYQQANRLRIPLSGATVPASLKRIELTVQIAGRLFTQTFSNQANQAYPFQWDGLDAYGRRPQGKQPARIQIGFVYAGTYQKTTAFGYNGNGVPIMGDLARNEITISTVYTRQLGTFDLSRESIGGWTLSAHHAYDPAGRILYQGDGTKRSAGTSGRTIETIAGTGAVGFSGDNGPAKSAKLNGPSGVAIGPDGAVYIADYNNHRIRKIDGQGIITTIAGTGTAGILGDGGPANKAQINAAHLRFAPDGSLILSLGDARVRKISPAGIISTLAGNGISSSSGDGGPALLAKVTTTCAAAPAADGTIYIVELEASDLRAIKPDGTIIAVAGYGGGGDGGPAVLAGLNLPTDLALGPDDAVWIGDTYSERLRRVGADGIITTVAGGGNPTGNDGDGGPATMARVRIGSGSNGTELANDVHGNIYFTERATGRIRCVSVDGLISTVVGNGARGFSGDGGPATAASIESAGFAVAPDGTIYFADIFTHRIRRVAPPLAGFTGSDFAVASEDGRELFRFDASGRHLETRDTFTGAVVMSFGYDANGQLVKVTDGYGNVTAIHRTAGGDPTAIVGPTGIKTTLTASSGRLASVTDPLGHADLFTYDADGLLKTETDALGNLSNFTFDTAGLLTLADFAGPYSLGLARVAVPAGFFVRLTTPLAVKSDYQIEALPGGGERRTLTDTASLVESETRDPNGTRMITYPSGISLARTLGPDARFSMQAPVETKRTLTTPGGKVRTIERTQTATLTDPADSLKLGSFAQTFAINGRTFATTYDAATRERQETTPLGRVTISQTNAQGDPTRRQRANLNPLSFAYDAKGKLTALTLGTGAAARATKFAYDARGLPATITSALGEVARLACDAAGRGIRFTAPDGGILMLGRDAAGRIGTVKVPSGETHTLAYEVNGQLASYTPPGGATTTFAHNGDTLLSLLTRPGGATVAYTYDTADRLSTRTAGASTATFVYDAIKGTLNTVTMTGGDALALSYDGTLPTGTAWTGTVAGSVTRTLDDDLRTASQSVNGANTVAWSYDNDGFVKAAGALTITLDPQTGFAAGTTLGSVTDTTTRDGFGDVTAYLAQANGTKLFEQQHIRDKAGRLVRTVENFGGSADTYEYKYANGRLTDVAKNGVHTAYDYDENGNRIKAGAATAVYDTQDRVTQSGATTLTYTDAGDLLSKVSPLTTTYTYDAQGNLTRVVLPGGVKIEYVIDGLNRRVGKKVDGVLKRGFLYQDKRRIVAELDGSKALVCRFVYMSNGHVPAYLTKGGVNYRLVTDVRGSVRLVVNTADGTVAQRLDYDAFGKVLADSAPGFQPFGFAGGLYDPETKLVRFGRRDYDVETARWTTRDPILFQGGDFNLYVYAGNDPINRRDEAGTSANPPDRTDRLPEEIRDSPKPFVPEPAKYAEPENPFDPTSFDKIERDRRDRDRQHRGVDEIRQALAPFDPFYFAYPTESSGL